HYKKQKNLYNLENQTVKELIKSKQEEFRQIIGQNKIMKKIKLILFERYKKEFENKQPFIYLNSPEEVQSTNNSTNEIESLNDPSMNDSVSSTEYMLNKKRKKSNF
ncbi:hypothetical protein Mgra_00006977, partial [Meloidogyne graminicola]